MRGLVESSVPEHTPTPAASPDDFGMLDTSMLSSSFEEDGPPPWFARRQRPLASN